MQTRRLTGKGQLELEGTYLYVVAMFLNSDLADSIQYVCLMLEFTGIALALIELRFPMFAEQLASHFKEQGRFRFKFPRDLIFIAAGVFVGELAVTLVQDPHTRELLMYTLLYLGAAVSIAYTVSAYWLTDRSVGVFGLTLAFFGFVGEVYQSLTGLILG